jgi:hypothetical protein
MWTSEIYLIYNIIVTLYRNEMNLIKLYKSVCSMSSTRSPLSPLVCCVFVCLCFVSFQYLLIKLTVVYIMKKEVFKHVSAIGVSTVVAVTTEVIPRSRCVFNIVVIF